MRNVRIISRLDIKGHNLVKGVQLEGLRKIGDPNTIALEYYNSGIDEVIYMDIVASLYDRNSLDDIIIRTTQELFVPITVGGGIRSIEDGRRILKSGADKLAVNTAAIKNPQLITMLSQEFGSQAMVLSIEAKRTHWGWEAYYDNGREKTGIDAIEWAIEAERLGAGELLVTSVDQEGSRKGFDIPLIKAITDSVRIPVIASGGAGSVDQIVRLVKETNVDAIALASLLHYKLVEISEIKSSLLAHGIEVRERYEK